MRLLHESAIGPETTGRLRALSPDLEVVDATATDAFDLDALEDPELEILVWRRPPADLTRVPGLRWLQLRSHGVDHLAADPPWNRGLVVTTARGVYSIPMAEYVTGMILHAHLPPAWAADQAAHVWPSQDVAARATVIRGKTALIVGYGSIGREVARQLAALGMRIVAVKARPDLCEDTGFRVPGTGDPDGSIPDRIVGGGQLAEVVREADVVILALPLTEASRGIFGAEAVAAMRPEAWFVNVSRGALVDEPALLDGLRAGRPGGAILDVVAQEPLPSDSPLWETPRVVITPHVSSMPMPAYYDDLVVENVRRYLADEPLLNQVDPERGY